MDKPESAASTSRKTTKPKAAKAKPAVADDAPENKTIHLSFTNHSVSGLDCLVGKRQVNIKGSSTTVAEDFTQSEADQLTEMLTREYPWISVSTIEQGESDDK